MIRNAAVPQVAPDLRRDSVTVDSRQVRSPNPSSQPTAIGKEAMTATYRAVMLTGKGGPKALDVLKVVTLPVEEPGPGQVRVRVRAAGVGSTDFLVGRRVVPLRPEDPLRARLRDRGRRRCGGPGRRSAPRWPAGRGADGVRRIRRDARARCGALPAHPRRRLRSRRRSRDPELRDGVPGHSSRRQGASRPDRARDRRRRRRRHRHSAAAPACRREDVRRRVLRQARHPPRARRRSHRLPGWPARSARARARAERRRPRVRRDRRLPTSVRASARCVRVVTSSPTASWPRPGSRPPSRCSPTSSSARASAVAAGASTASPRSTGRIRSRFARTCRRSSLCSQKGRSTR